MTEQLRLPGVDPPRQIRPDTSQDEPVLWVRRLCVLRTLEAGDEHFIRDIQFRRGLNIIWAPPQHAGDQNALFRSGVGGHTAGKTTLCCLLRHALGEGSFAPEATRRRIRARLPQGWVVAEIVVAGQLWAVARPFAIGPHPFCVEGGSVDDAITGGDRIDYQTFLVALADATTVPLPAWRFPAREEPVRWEHILPWLSRDQECRFSDFLEWRHSSTGSDVPSLQVDERQFVVRSVLGLITDDERQEQQRNARLVANKKAAEKTAPLLAHEADVDHARVKRLLAIDVPPPASGLFGLQARAELERRKADLARRLQAHVAADPRDELRSGLEKCIEAETNAQRDVKDSEARLAAERAAVKLLTGRVQGEEQTDLLASLPPPRDYCNVPMTLARERGCPIATARPFDLAEKRSERSAADELKTQHEIVQALEVEAKSKCAALQEAEAGTRKARRVYMKAVTTYDEQSGLLREEATRLKQATRLVADAERAWQRSEEQSEAIKGLASDIETSYARQEKFRQAGRKALAQFSSMFDYVVRALLGDQVTARVETAGRALTLTVDEHGERESAALETLKLWAFDMAAMTQSVEGQGFFPRFLLHDGPREGDIAPDIYERLFLYAYELEACFSGEPSFQYIVTTTTRPPESLIAEPWLRLRLAGTPAEQRLLSMDL